MYTDPNKSLNILHIFGHNYGGTFVLNQVIRLRSRGHIVRMVCPAEGPLTIKLRAAGIPVSIVPFGGSRLKDIPRIGASVIRLARLIRYNRPDVVHYHLIKATVVGRISSLLARAPVRVSQLGGPLSLEIAFFKHLDLLTAWIDTAIIASSGGIEKIYRRYPQTRKKLVRIYYGLDFTSFRSNNDGSTTRREFGIQEGEPVVGMVAYMYSSSIRRFRRMGIKGHEVLIEAARYVLESRPDVRFLIVGDELVGDGTYSQRLRRMAREIGAGERIVFAGNRTDVIQCLAAMDVVAVPSLSENVGGALEPLLARRPVIASNVGGLPDVVIDGQTGRLVPPAEPRALAAAILDVLSLPESERRRMGENGHRLVTQLFDLEKTTDQLESLYFKAVRDRK